MAADPHGQTRAYDLPPSALFDPAGPGLRVVLLGDVLRAPELDSDPSPLLLALGIDEPGRPVTLDLARAPHLLVSGATGSGKSTSLHTMLVSVLARTPPDQVRFAMVDTRGLELPRYDRAPHMLTPAVKDPAAAVKLLAAIAREAEVRCDMLAAARVRSIKQFNLAVRSGRLPGTTPTLPYLLLVVDDAADLGRPPHADHALAALTTVTSLGRTAGIHAVIVTQYPGPTVIPAQLAANIPCRLEFGSTAATGTGPTRRLRPGEAVLRAPSYAGTRTVRGALVSEREIGAVVTHCARQYPDALGSGDCEPSDAVPAPPQDPVPLDMLVQAAELVIGTQFGSVSMVQRKLGVGFSSAVAVFVELERHGIVGSGEGALPRLVLVRPADCAVTLRRLACEDAPPQ